MIDYCWHCRSLDAQLADLVMLFPQLSRLELRRTLERVGNDFDVAIAAIVGENDMANCVDDPDNRKEHQPGNNRSIQCNQKSLVLNGHVFVVKLD